jgi:hypothetical protein
VTARNLLMGSKQDGGGAVSTVGWMVLAEPHLVIVQICGDGDSFAISLTTRAAWSTDLPQLTKFLLTSHGPVVLNALNFQLIFFQP